MESVASTPGSITLGPAFTTRPADSVTPTVTSDTRPTSPSEPTCITGATDRRAKNAHVTTEYFTSSTEPIFHHEATCTRGFASSYAEPATAAETFSLTRSFSTTTASTAGRLSFTTGPTSTGTESPSNTGPINSNWEHITSMAVPTYCSVYTRATGPILIPAPLESLEQLAQKGDDTHFPQYLHQVTYLSYFFHMSDTTNQWALWCIQLERLYHQRLLDNLNTLQEQWGNTRLTDKEHSDRGGGEAEGEVEYTITVIGNGQHPSIAGGMDQSKPAEQQGGDLGPAQEKEAKREEEEKGVEKAAEALEMKDEGEEEEEQKQKDRYLCPNVLMSLCFLLVYLLSSQMSPASGLVSILKKRSVCEDNTSLFAGSLPRPDKPTAKRRVRFRVPDDSYENDVGGGDSCLLLFLLCLVTVVISVGGTALYCALGDSQSSVCQDFSRNADFYVGELQRRIAQIQHWFTPGS
uniref:Uncharacterized protein n=1 Tax=Monopterus albus TaxID=43700 RepID=A0A3Q3J9H6_MONAL